ncbi:MAG: Mrp/NBP35 family ATP-binding protein [Spirochaetia bacterium]|nr:Mrp/NBP35 family ATP-binding protein [Spirochaetia bacterium]
MDQATIESQIKDVLGNIEHPTYKENIMSLGMFGKLEEEGDSLRLVIKTPNSEKKAQIALEAAIRTATRELNLPKKLVIKFETDPELKIESQEGKIKGIKNIIAIGSGKGGVGKSTVTANLAAAIQRRGMKVGILDADVYGPSMGRLFGMDGRLALEADDNNRIHPTESNGIKIMSFSFLLEGDQAVVWRGPMLGKAIEQFLFEVQWGELDFLLVDLPPGTGDVQLSLAQMINLDGSIIVSTPQNVALLDASRALSMFNQVRVPCLGVVENMSEFICPECGHKTHIFSTKGPEEFSQKYNVPMLGSVPIMKEIMESGETGKPIVLEDGEGPVAKAYDVILENVLREVERYK